jgi:putative ABC transport system permease protein
LRHKGKSLIIGLILFLGSLLMTVGNGVISGMDHGLEQNVVNGFLGDVVIISEKQKTDNILLDFTGTLIEPITNYPQIKKLLQAERFVSRFLPAGKNMSLALSDDYNATPGFAYLLGVDFAEYQAMFPDSLKALEGRLFKPGERGILVPKKARDEFYNFTNRWLIPEGCSLVEANLSKDAKENLKTIIKADNIVLLGMNENNSSTDLRFGIKGVIAYRTLNTIFGHFSITDIESYRECLGYFSSSAHAIQVAKEDQKLLDLDTTNLDSLFGTESLMVSNPQAKPTPAPAAIAAAKAPADVDIEAGVYNMIFVKLKKGTSYNYAVSQLNKIFTANQAKVRAVTWKKASGFIGSMTTIIKGSLLAFVSLLFLVAIIIIVNTLTMAALERTPELGMMRAIGAQKQFVRLMFLSETAILSLVFGGAGFLLGAIIVNLIPMLNITSANDMVQLLYGGDIFHPLLKWTDIVVTLLELSLVTLIAAIYPIRVAGGIKPLDAIARD